jgi:hypothetical protein
MYFIPVPGALLTLVPSAASRTVTKDAESLQRWMRDSSAGGAQTQAALT